MGHYYRCVVSYWFWFGGLAVLVRLKRIMKVENLTQKIMSEWTLIPWLKFWKKLEGRMEFTTEERRVITEIFMGKYTENELFGKDEVNENGNTV